MDPRARLLLLSVLLLAAAVSVTATTYAWMHDDGDAGMDISTGQVEASVGITYLMDTSADGTTVGEKNDGKTFDEVKQGYGFGFNDDAVAKAAGADLRVTGMMPNDSLEVGISGTIVSTVRTAYRVSAVLTGNDAGNFTCAITMNDEPVEDTDLWLCMESGEKTFEGKLELGLKPGASAAGLGVRATLEVQAYQITGLLPDGTVQRDETAGSLVIQRIAGGCDEVGSVATSFLAPSDGTYTVSCTNRISGTSRVVSSGNTYDLVAGMTVSGQTLGSTSEVWTFAIDDSILTENGFAEWYGLLAMDSAGALSELSLSSKVTSKPSSSGEYRIDAAAGTIEVCTAGIYGCFLAYDPSVAEYDDGNGNTTRYIDAYEALTELKSGGTVTLLKDAEVSFDQPIEGVTGTFQGGTDYDEMHSLTMTTTDSDGTLNHLFLDPQGTFNIKFLEFQSSTDRAVALVKSTLKDNELIFNCVRSLEKEYTDANSARAPFVDEFHGAYLYLWNGCANYASMNVPDQSVAAFIGKLSPEGTKFACNFTGIYNSGNITGKNAGLYFADIGDGSAWESLLSESLESTATFYDPTNDGTIKGTDVTSILGYCEEWQTFYTLTKLCEAYNECKMNVASTGTLISNYVTTAP